MTTKIETAAPYVTPAKVTLAYEDLDWGLSVWLPKRWRIRVRFYIMRNPCIQFTVLGYPWICALRVEFPPIGAAFEVSRYPNPA